MSNEVVTEKPARPQRVAHHFTRQRVRLAPDQARRQGDISQLAFLELGGRDPAIAFLNGDCASLGGRPLDIAIASAEGYERVAQVIRSAGPPPISSTA